MDAKTAKLAVMDLIHAFPDDGFEECLQEMIDRATQTLKERHDVAAWAKAAEKKADDRA